MAMDVQAKEMVKDQRKVRMMAIKASLGPLPGRLLTYEEVAAYTGLSVQYFKQGVSDKTLTLKPVYIGRAVRFRLAALDAWIAEQGENLSQ